MRCVLRCRLNMEKVCQSQVMLSVEFTTVGSVTWKARVLKASFIQVTVRRLAEVEQRNVDGAYGMRMSDKYDTVPEKKNLVCKCGKFVSYVIYPFHSVRVCQPMCNSVMLLYK